MAAEAGFAQVEFWTASDKDLPPLEAAIRDTGLTVTAFVSEPTGRLVDPQTHDAFLAGIERSCGLAQRLNARNLIVVAGDARAGVGRDLQREALTTALRRAAPIAATYGVRLLLEPLNTRVDHPGYFLDSTSEALDVIRDVGEQSVALLYDMYHSIVMGEDPGSALDGAGALLGHVHIADAPGRHEPGAGAVDWRRQLAALRSVGYEGSIGLEYIPTRETSSTLGVIRDLVNHPV